MSSRQASVDTLFESWQEENSMMHFARQIVRPVPRSHHVRRRTDSFSLPFLHSKVRLGSHKSALKIGRPSINDDEEEKFLVKTEEEEEEQSPHCNPLFAAINDKKTLSPFLDCFPAPPSNIYQHKVHFTSISQPVEQPCNSSLKLLTKSLELNRIEYITNEAASIQCFDMSSIKIASAGWDVTPVEENESILIKTGSNVSGTGQPPDTLLRLYDYFDYKSTVPEAGPVESVDGIQVDSIRNDGKQQCSKFSSQSTNESKSPTKILPDSSSLQRTSSKITFRKAITLSLPFSKPIPSTIPLSRSRSYTTTDISGFRLSSPYLQRQDRNQTEEQLGERYLLPSSNESQWSSEEDVSKPRYSTMKVIKGFLWR